MNAARVRRPLIAMLGIGILYAWAVLRMTRPPAPIPASAPDSVFSAQRALHYVGEIARAPHPVGSVNHAVVRDYVIQQLVALGVHPDVQRTTGIGTRYQAAGYVENIVATLPGRTPNGHALLLVAHYDGVAAGPAASDDGAGTAALLETLHALRARKTPLAHDVIFLFTDGEESGLLGAAAFVREHPLARTVSFILNFEARGTTGRALMFETGEGNMDAVRALRAAKHVTASSVSTAVYRALPNDTDLSELSQLRAAALNFAFIGGVERYHTSHDDPTYLNPGSLQHMGDQMLAVAARVADGELPRRKTSDAAFFDLPLLGLVIYPVAFVIPLMVIALVCTAIVVRRTWTASVLGAVLIVISIALLAIIARSINLTGPARWSPLYATALVLGAAGVSYEISRIVRRMLPDAWTGALVLWLLLTVATSVYAPTVSYLFLWPLLFALIAARSAHIVAQWVAAAVTILLVGGFGFVMAGTALGLGREGAIALVVVTSLMTWLLLPVVDQVAPPTRRTSSLVFFVPAALLVVVALGVAAPSPAHPTPTALTYSENTHDADAWLGTALRPDDWARTALGTLNPAPAWVLAGAQVSQSVGHAVARVGLEAPTATMVSDSTVGQLRRVVIRVTAPKDAERVVMRVTGARVQATTIDSRPVDTSRYRHPLAQWEMQYWAVPASGALVGLTVAAGREIDFDVASRVPGLPTISGVTIPPRPSDVVAVQDGDVSVVYHHSRF